MDFNALMEYLRAFNLASATLRLFLSLLLGGLLGLERGLKHRPAGFRTYTLVCIGSALAMLTSLYVTGQTGGGDPLRLGAQVISGIGFLGAGTIVLTGRNQVTGLTTAAGLWAAACMGLAVGAGFYEGAILSFVLLFAVLELFSHLDSYFLKRSRVVDLFVEFSSVQAMSAFLEKVKNEQVRVLDIGMGKSRSGYADSTGAVFSFSLPPRKTRAELISLASSCEGVLLLDEVG